MKPPTEKWNKGDHSVRLVWHDPDTNLSNLWLDDLTTATAAHGLQLHPTKTKAISNTTSKPSDGVNLEILPPEGEIKYHDHGPTKNSNQGFSQAHAHFILSGTRSEQEYPENVLCTERVCSQQGKGLRPTHLQRVHWTSDHCHCHDWRATRTRAVAPEPLRHDRSHVS